MCSASVVCRPRTGAADMTGDTLALVEQLDGAVR